MRCRRKSSRGIRPAVSGRRAKGGPGGTGRGTIPEAGKAEPTMRPRPRNSRADPFLTQLQLDPVVGNRSIITLQKSG
jgi:hypothetical protein